MTPLRSKMVTRNPDTFFNTVSPMKTTIFYAQQTLKTRIFYLVKTLFAHFRQPALERFGLF
jgi:hypothetical protein